MHTLTVKGTTIARIAGFKLTEYVAGADIKESYYVITNKAGEPVKQFYADPKKNHKEARKTFTEEARLMSR